MSRQHRAKLGQETVRIVQEGSYTAADSSQVEFQDLISDCLEKTALWSPQQLERLTEGLDRNPHCETRFKVFNETTLTTARRMVVEQNLSRTLCLNFASAKKPGGGFLGGSQAQEESLARSSALYDSLLRQQDFYDINRTCGTCLYTDYMIYSPNVPVIRLDDGNLLAKPYPLSILTSPAVNAGAVRKNEPSKAGKILPVMIERINKVLALSLHLGYEHLILGAWGCGVFRNDPVDIAKLFANALKQDERFMNRFKTVTFTVLDGSKTGSIIKPFLAEFG